MTRIHLPSWMFALSLAAAATLVVGVVLFSILGKNPFAAFWQTSRRPTRA